MIYVDNIATFDTSLHSKQWCHLATDGALEELHAMARRLQLKREYFQDKPNHPHYDLTPSKRAQALAFGATAVSNQELILKCFPVIAAIMRNEKLDTLCCRCRTQPATLTSPGGYHYCLECGKCKRVDHITHIKCNTRVTDFVPLPAMPDVYVCPCVTMRIARDTRKREMGSAQQKSLI